ncbi:MAG: SusC/RagA family TonB-linked outer membrane protein [Sphingobacterium composti]
MKYKLGICSALIACNSWAMPMQKIHIEKNRITIQQYLDEIKKQTNYSIVHLDNIFDKNKIIDQNLKNTNLQDALDKVFTPNGISYAIKDKTIVLSKKNNVSEQQQRSLQIKALTIDGLPASGVTIFIKNSSTAIGQTSATGLFTANIPTGKVTLLFKHVSYQEQEVIVNDEKAIQVFLKEKGTEIEETVITGIYNRTRESFTGSSATYTAKELKMVNNQNILQALRTLDPAFALEDNIEFGSDPNTLADVSIRGKTSVIGLNQEFENDPNQPLFILDGYETSLQVISDLNMDRVESITVLKDAAATAIYGSKSANGVIVVETKRPEAGTFKVSYNVNTSVNFADLSDYNLMNSEEKLRFERLSGYYGAVDANGEILLESDNRDKYYSRLAEARRGVDTYWMNEPLRVALSQSHNIYADGGDQKMRYGIGLTYGKTPGVMKGSERDAVNGNFRLIYRTGNFSFSNNLTVDNVTANREPVSFSNYSSANPYFRKYDEYGDVLRVVESFVEGRWENSNFNRTVNVFNPMYDATVNYLDKSPSFNFGNNLDLDWRLIPSFRLRGRLGLSKTSSKAERFISPRHSQYENTPVVDRGSYTSSLTDGIRYNGDVTATFGKLFSQKHLVNLVAGIRLDHSNQITNGFSVQGFMEDLYPNPAFSNGYGNNTKPRYTENERRSASYYFNSGYVFNNKYLVDASFRSDGSSLFGVENQFTSTWATGLGWNIHNEDFMKSFPFISYLKLRASMGNPGNQNFDARMTMNIYTYNLENPNPFGLSALISTWGNQNLDWQKTIDKNIGLDVEILDRRLRLNFDYFNKLTDPLLVQVDVPTSTGTATVPMNIGTQKTRGLTISSNYQIIKSNDLMWTVNANARNTRVQFANFGNALDRFNTESRSRSLQRFYDGGSPSDMWAVRSAGIDPATGREIFIKKDGTQTFVHDYKDEVKVGNTTPDLEGIIGTTIFYKGFNLSMNFRYRVGGQIMQSALYNKVENISIYSLKSNQDRRALYDRWQKPGDIAKFRGISLTDQTPISSRFVANENTFSAESISAGYDFRSARLSKLGISGLNVRGYMNQIFRISSVKEERGINFPFARSVSFSLGARF